MTNTLRVESPRPVTVQTYTLQQLQDDVHGGKYTSAGSYPKFFVSHDGAVCWTCVNKRMRHHIAQFQKSRPTIIASGVNWEDPECYCVECECRIESAYAEPES